MQNPLDHDRDHHPYEQSYRPKPLPRRSLTLPALVAGGLAVTLGFGLLSRAARHVEEPVAVRQASGVEPGTELVAGAAPPTSSTVGVTLSPDIVVGCYLARQAAYFQYDEANRLPGDMRRLDNVARCLGGGPLQGRALRIVGFVGPNGDGSPRDPHPTRAVANYLVESGITPSRLIEVARGKDLTDAQASAQPVAAEHHVLIELAP